jgi:hypothetical protein
LWTDYQCKLSPETGIVISESELLVEVSRLQKVRLKAVQYVYVVPEVQITQPPATGVGQVGSERRKVKFFTTTIAL